MRLPALIGITILPMTAALFGADEKATVPVPAASIPKPVKPVKLVNWPPKLGVKTVGVQVPFANLKADAEIVVPAGADWMAFTDALLVPNQGKDEVEKIDAKTNKLTDPIVGLSKPCSGAASGFGSTWIANCGDRTLARLDSKTGKVTKTLAIGASTMRGSIAVTTDSVWMMTDDKITLSRIDPAQDSIVAELRLPAGCRDLTFAESSLWVLCPAESKVLRINPETNVVDKTIDVAAQPLQLIYGETSIWVLSKKEGKVERLDPKTNKIAKAIDLGVPGVDGSIALGEGALWVALEGFPITRISTEAEKEKVVQQFAGEGGGMIAVAQSAVWLLNPKQAKLIRYDPKRIAATFLTD